MTVEALLKQLRDEHKDHTDDAMEFALIRDHYYKCGRYDIGLKYDLKRVESSNEADAIIKTIIEIEKRVS